MMRSLVFVIAVALTLAACQKPSELKYKLYVFGTLVEIIVYDADKKQADTAIATLSSGFQRMHDDWHAWKPGKTTELNKAIREGRPYAVPADIIALIRDGQRFERLSEGLFNPAIGALIELWGFHADEKPTGPPPPRDRIAELVAAHPSMMDLTIKNGIVTSSNKSVQLDFGGFAKGSALDWAAAQLKAAGIKNAIINAGGGMSVIGDHGERPWKIGIYNPTNWGIIAAVNLRTNEALHTSGNYHRFREFEGLRYSHILDPRTGWPVEHIVSASVIHTESALADAAATALTVAGPDHWVEIARHMDIDEALLVDDKGGLHVTPKMKERLTFETDGNPVVEVADPDLVPDN